VGGGWVGGGRMGGTNRIAGGGRCFLEHEGGFG